MSRSSLAAVVAVALTVAACGADPAADPSSTTAVSTPETPATLVVAVTLAPYADLVSRVGGDRVDVRSVVPAGLDGHTYEPAPSDVRTFAEADIVFLPDAQLNPRITDLALANVSPDGAVVDLNADTLQEEEIIYTDAHSHGDGPAHGHNVNPHTWTNLPFAERYVEAIAAELAAADAAGAESYAINRDVLLAGIRQLDSAARQAIETIPAANRTLVVYHDSWSYFGREYGFEVIGALQAVDFSEPSAAEMRNMVDQVLGANVPSFFGSVVFPTAVLEQVAAESGVTYVGNLSDDALPGAPGDPKHSYVGMMADNVRTIVQGLGGDSSPIDAVAP
jgi:ABC-type Zn uptake system ZnuABC Zn-binding protein ZnuA